MATKNDKNSFVEQSFTTSENQYFNLNLNQSEQFATLIPVQFFSKSNNDKYCASDNFEEKEKSQSWNKSSKGPTLTTLNEDSDDFKQRWKNGNALNATNKSTLSLHISAYKNPNASDLFYDENNEGSKKEKFKSIKTSDSLKFRNPFEFSRQQNGAQKNKPEVMQFKASQKLRPTSSQQTGQNNVRPQRALGTPATGGITRKPLVQQQQQKPGAGKVEEKKKLFDLGCCKKQKGPPAYICPKKAAPPKGSKKRSFGSLFSRKKTNVSKPSTTTSKSVSRFSRLGVRTPNQLPQKPKQPVVSVISATSAAAAKSKPKTPQKLGVAKPKDKSDKKKNVKKLQPKSESKKSQKSSIDSPKKSEKEMKTAMEKSLREGKNKPKPTSKSSSKSHGKDVSHESRRKNYQEVKISITNTDDGMTERKVTLINAYPQNELPPKPFFGSLSYPQKKKSYASSKSVTSIDRLSPAHLPSASEQEFLTSPIKSSPHLPSASEQEFLTSPIKSSRASSSTKQQQQQQLQLYSPKTYRDRALSTIHQLRASYQLSHHEIRNLSKNPELKITTIRAGNALLEAQRNLRNLKILAGTNLLPDLTLFNDELSVVIHELDRFIDAIQTVSEHAETSP
uniref:Uncharacterized protein n=1 Tax=Panagrolaimus sp. PS1159 TaxID=55785 RepID=A0AC35FFB0_9BILA